MFVVNDEIITGLPKVVRDTLRNLASKEDVEDITRMLLASLENVECYDEGERVEVELEAQILIENWSEGVEDLNGFTEDQLWEKLGLPDKKIPFFQEWTDPDALIDPWSAEGQTWLKDSTKGQHPLKPRWHQLVGIYRMLQRIFENKPVLLMDGVGLGKTMQAVGAIACLTYYRKHFEVKKQFPGDFGEYFGDSDIQILITF